MKKSSMRLAKTIYDYVKAHGEVTRPKLYEALDANEKSIDDRIRKLLEYDMLVDTGKVVRGEGPRPCHILALGPVDYSPTIFAPGKRGPKVLTHNENLVRQSLDFLETFIRGSISHVNAECEDDVHTGRGNGDRGLGLGLGGPTGSDVGERLQRDEGFIPGGAETLPRRGP